MRTAICFVAFVATLALLVIGGNRSSENVALLTALAVASVAISILVSVSVVIAASRNWGKEVDA